VNPQQGKATPKTGILTPRGGPYDIGKTEMKGLGVFGGGGTHLNRNVTVHWAGDGVASRRSLKCQGDWYVGVVIFGFGCIWLGPPPASLSSRM